MQQYHTPYLIYVRAIKEAALIAKSLDSCLQAAEMAANGGKGAISGGLSAQCIAPCL